MTRKTTSKNAITFIKIILALSFSWPLSKSASKFQITCFKILRSLFCMNTVILSVPIAYTLYRNDYDLPRITKLWCTLGAMIQVSVEMTQCALQYDRLQVRNAYLYVRSTFDKSKKPFSICTIQFYTDINK